MSVWEVSLRARWEYPFIDLSRSVHDTPISMWCIWDRELLQVPRRDEATDRAVERGIRRAGRIIDKWADAGPFRVFLLQCTCEKYASPWNVIGDHDCWETPPIVYRDGWAYLRVQSFDADRPRALFRDLRRRGTVELVRKRELGLSVLPTSVYASTLFGELTAKQSEALLAAYRYGYYASPRQTTTEEIAARIGIGRTTYEEHLRKAENRVIAALVPHLELYATTEHAPDDLPMPAAPIVPSSAPGVEP